MNGSDEGQERREHGRLPCEGVLLSYRKPSFLSGLLGSRSKRGTSLLPVRNITRGGLCFLGRKPLRSGQRLRVTVRFGRKGRRFAAEGMVAWLGPGKGRYPVSVGLRFTRLDRHAWRTLGRLPELLARLREDPSWKEWRLRARTRKSRIWGERDQTLRV